MSMSERSMREAESDRSGVTRREALRRGAWGALGSACLAGSVSAQAGPDVAIRPSGFGSAKRCLLLYLWGSPSQLETLDPKPDAPAEVRGEFGSIATAVPGVRVGEILPRLAQRLDRVTILRSLTHSYPIHGTAFAVTSVPSTDLELEGNVRDPRHWPFIGSIVDYLGERDDSRPPEVPRNFGLPFPIGSRRRIKPGQFGGFLGGAYDTMWSEFRAPGIREVLRDAGAPDVPTKIVADPFLGIRPADRFEAAGGEVALGTERMRGLVNLLDQLGSSRAAAELRRGAASFERHRAQAQTVVLSGKVRAALDVQRESSELRERYGMTLFGQSCLAARRLLEAGGKFVTVCWDEYGLVNTGWDTHVYARSRLKDELGPGFDLAFAALLDDLDERGLLADTAIAVISEHGRTPRVQNVAEGGRDHWARAYSSLFAGAGFARGRVVGRTDAFAGEVAENPFSPKDVVATLLHTLGIDPALEIRDAAGRTHPVGGMGRVRSELLA